MSKTLLNDKLSLSISGMVGLNKGGKLNIESYNKGTNYTAHNNISVPIYGVTFTASYTFGNTQIMTRQKRQSRIQNDFIEQQSQSEMYNSIGDVNQQ